MTTPMGDEILFLAFNQDATSLQVGTRRAYKLFTFSNVDELKKLHENALEEVCLLERLFSSSLVTVVSMSSPRKLRVCHFQKNTEICNHSYSNTVLAVRLNRLRLVVCLEESLYIHNIKDMKVVHTIRDTPPNLHGLCDLAPGDISYLAYPGSSHAGEVHLFDTVNLQAVTTISAHDSPLAAMKFNADGLKLATASEKGTVIRVFGCPSGERLFEFRRGMKRCVTIYSLAFSLDSMYLAAASNTETVHVFKLDHDKDTRAAPFSESPGTSPAGAAGSGGGWMDYVSKTAANYLPTGVSEMLHQDRAFAYAHLPREGSKNIAALAVIQKQLRLMVASNDGFLYIYNFDLLHGGECSLVRQHQLSQATDASQAQAGDTIVRTGSPALTPSGPSSGGAGTVSPPKTSYAATAGASLDSPDGGGAGESADTGQFAFG